MRAAYAERVGHKFDDPFSVFLYDLALESFEDDSEEFGGTTYLRFGRHILTIDDQGFVSSVSYRNRVDAVAVIEDLRSFIDWRTS